MKTIRRIKINNEVKILSGINLKYKEISNSDNNLSRYKFLPPVDPKVIVCVHLNYRSRLNELKRVQIIKHLKEKSDAEYDSGDYKGCIRSLRRMEKYY